MRCWFFGIHPQCDYGIMVREHYHVGGPLAAGGQFSQFFILRCALS